MIKKLGFTLVELLVVFALFVILALFATQSFATIFQTRGKAEVSKNVRQEAEYAISVMERHLRNAISATCPSSTQVSYLDSDGRPTFFSCINPGSPNSYLASGSAALGLTTGEVVVKSCTFTCTTNPSIITISFELEQAQPTTDPRERASVSVSSQVILRNQ